jgi:hypothetical protein
VPPAVPIFPMIARTRSFGVTPAGSAPSHRTSIDFDFFCVMVCVASTCSTSLVPMPNARRPERAIGARVRIAADDRHPRQHRACSGAIHVHDPLAMVLHAE